MAPGAVEEGASNSGLFNPFLVNGRVIDALSARPRVKNAHGQRYPEQSRRITTQIAGSVTNAKLHRTLADTEAPTPYKGDCSDGRSRDRYGQP